MKVVCISDTHNKHQYATIPEGDLIIHSGDFTVYGSEKETLTFAEWFKNLPHKHKVVIPGNHDKVAQQYGSLTKAMFGPDVHYLDEWGVEIEGNLIWGSPWTPTFGYGWAFNADPGADIQRHWAKIPDNTNILVTHGPPYGYLDNTFTYEGEMKHVGCPDLLARLKELKELKLHVFGHIHPGRGVSNESPYGIAVNPTTTITSREGYQHAYEPIIVHL